MARDNVKFQDDKGDDQTKTDKPEVGPGGHAGDRVTVMCKLPHGLVIRGFEMREERELVMGGGSREVKMARPTGQAIRVFGPSAEFGKQARAIVTPSGYAMTSNFPKDLWDQWFEANKNSDMVKNRLIYAEVDRSRAIAASKELFETRSGLEQLDPEKDPRAPRRPANMEAVSPSDEMQERFKRMEDGEAVLMS